jgi:hypothetical protein
MLEERVKATLNDAVKNLTGSKKRTFMDQVAADYFDSSARKAETYLGWGHSAVQLDLHECQVWSIGMDNYSSQRRPNNGRETAKTGGRYPAVSG